MRTEGTAGVVSGSIGAWRWVEDWSADLDCREIVRHLQGRLSGLRGVCTSWDSGRLEPEEEGLLGWASQNGHAVSPPVDEELAASWPRSSCGSGYDEWYFFRGIPPIGPLHPVCSWGMSLADAAALKRLPKGFDIQEQLTLAQPELVVGDGRRVFAITRDQTLVREFTELCRSNELDDLA
jgi:hypothetical protein